MLFDGVLALVGLAMVVPLFVPSRWRGKREMTEPEQYQGTTASFPDLQATQTMQADGGLLADWAQTKPQPQAEPGNPSPPSTSQAPWGPAEYSCSRVAAPAQRHGWDIHALADVPSDRSDPRAHRSRAEPC